MIHSFDVAFAMKCGVNAAIIFQHLAYWIKHNEANEINCFDGNYWTFNSIKAFMSIFPYMGRRQIETALQKLIDEGLVVKGNYNKSSYDRTMWYAFTQKGKSISSFCEMDSCKMENGFLQNVQPIPDNNTDNNTDNDSNTISQSNKVNIINDNNICCAKKTKNFVVPSVEEVAAYCAERQNGIDADAFVNYYEARGWMLGKAKMKDWKAAVRTWERNRKQRNGGTAKPIKRVTKNGEPYEVIRDGEYKIHHADGSYTYISRKTMTAHTFNLYGEAIRDWKCTEDELPV